MSASPAHSWWIYVLCSAKGTTYVGIAQDVSRRLQQHNGLLPGGAKSTRSSRPWQLARLHGPVQTRAAAQRVEYALKSVRGKKRMRAAVRINGVSLARTKYRTTSPQ